MQTVQYLITLAINPNLLMKKQRLLLFVTLVAFTAFFVSCKKNGTSRAQCRITNIISDSTHSEIQLDYDMNKRLSIINNKIWGTKVLFSYKDNFIFKSIVDSSGNIMELDTAILTSTGLINSIVKYYPLHKDFVYDSISYDSHEELIAFAETYTGHKDVVNFVWDNGNIVKSTSNGLVVPYDYYTDKDAQDGDYSRITDILNWGTIMFKCKNQTKSCGSISISYTYDGDGKISTMTMLENGAVVYRYVYSCD